MSEHNLKLFPLRVKEKQTHAEKSKDGGHSFVPDKNEAVVPVGDNGYERTIRRHEALHAIFSPSSSPMTQVYQAAEDLRLHLNHSEAQGAVRRDEVMSALIEMRPIAKLYDPVPKDQSDIALGILIRSMAILAGSHGEYNSLINKVQSKIDCPKKAELGRSLRRAFKAIRNGDSATDAAKILRKHFNNPDQQVPTGGSGGKGNPWMSSWSYNDGNYGDSDYEFETIVGEISTDEADLLDKEMKAKLLKLAKGKQMPEFRIDNLHLSSSRNTDRGPQEIGTFSGSKIRAKKLAAAAAAPSGVRLFYRKKPMKGSGTVLIDASGSMSLKDKHLKQIIRAMPSGTVAYYSGQNNLKKGCLTIVAQKGKQYSFPPGVRLPNREGAGENVVDYEALSWLLKQDKPRYMVTDGQFCGSPLAAQGIPQKLLRQAIGRGIVTQITSVKHMKDLLKLEELPEAEGDDEHE